MASEYKTVSARWPEVETTFNQLAAEGWELVPVTSHIVTSIEGTERKVRVERLVTWAIFRKEKTA